MEILAYMTLYVIISAFTGLMAVMVAMVNDVDIIRWCKSKQISVNSIPALILVSGFLWPISIPATIGFVLFKAGQLLFSTFGSLFKDIYKIIKKR